VPGDPILAAIVAFLREIGLGVRFGTLDGGTVLPGIEVQAGTLVVDEKRLAHPGDLLHEAGHLAVMPPDGRAAAQGAVGADGGDEMGAIAWSYAAAVHLGLDPAVVFHAEGYRGGAAALAQGFTDGALLGVPILQWLGMSAEPRQAAALNRAPYPAMTRWLNAGN